VNRLVNELDVLLAIAETACPVTPDTLNDLQLCVLAHVIFLDLAVLGGEIKIMSAGHDQDLGLDSLQGSLKGLFILGQARADFALNRVREPSSGLR